MSATANVQKQALSRRLLSAAIDRVTSSSSPLRMPDSMRQRRGVKVALFSLLSVTTALALAFVALDALAR